jgi:hypothetical protein
MPRTTKREKRPAERPAHVPEEILDHFAPDRPMTAEEIDAAGRTNHRNARVRSAC